VVEEDDEETIAAALALAPYEIVPVPHSAPRTKPKACNYALQFARGNYLVVFDAEDRPEPDQLRKAVAAFRKDPGVACFQARLTIDNGREGWLARMFALDYGIWFNALLPGLDRLKAPKPLGGTSNHFRTSSLRQAGAWDPFNVTEDADLGFRLARLGYGVAMLDSTTFEAAPTRFAVWFRQRTRWMKGYMQTLLVHSRAPLQLVRNVGWRNCLLMSLFLGGAVWSALVNPLLWVIFALSCSGPGAAADLLDMLARISGLSLLTANVLLTAFSLAKGGGGRRFAELPFAFGYPLFWLLISAAAYRALWQLVRDPFRWEKTPHGAA
jgi:glycosyltransferase XagB